MSAPEQFFDGLLQFDLGMNSGVAPVLLPKNQLAFAANATVRGTFVHPRPPWFDYQLDFQGNSATQTAFLNGLWQGGCYYLPDSLGSSTLGMLGLSFTEPAIGADITILVNRTAPIAAGMQITIGTTAQYLVIVVGGTGNPVGLTVRNLTGTPGGLFAVGTLISGANASQSASLIVAISGRLFKVTPDPTTLSAIVIEVTGGNPQHPTAPQHWLWQAEKWVIWNDGINLPVFYDGSTNTTTRSVGNSTVTSPFSFTTVTTAPFNVPPTTHQPIDFSTDIVVAPLASSANLAATQQVNFVGFGLMTSFGVVDATHVNFLNANGLAPGTLIPAGTVLQWGGSAVVTNSTQLPAGRMGVYGKGRNWICLTDGRSFIASDIVGSSSGTAANDFRDSVLSVTENTYLVGGGTFRAPMSGGDIRAMIFQTESDTSLGQGPLLIFTPNLVFSCVAPVDRLTWQSLTNPILTVSLIGAGALGQNSVTNANGDVLFRSLLGVSSYILGRRDFDVWGNVPISREVSVVLDRDAENLLPYGSCVIFDNRLLMSCAPTVSALGVYHAGVVAINFDALSTMQGKKPSCWDGLWPGLNAFQMMVGEFALVNRCYAFCLDLNAKNIVLREVLSGKTDEIYDNGVTPITMTIEFPVMFREQDPSKRVFKKMDNGEIWVDELQQVVHFLVQYKPDDYPCWIDWLKWEECANMTAEGAMPAFRPRMGLGSPSANDCDPYTNRPFRLGYYFQTRLVITGQCRFKGAKFTATAVPEPKYSPPTCKPLC